MRIEIFIAVIVYFTILILAEVHNFNGILIAYVTTDIGVTELYTPLASDWHSENKIIHDQ